MDLITLEEKALSSLFGSESVGRVLLFLLVNGKGYPTQIARLFETPLTPIQKALIRLENGGIVSSEQVGKIRIYSLNPYFPLKKELENLLKKTYSLLSPHEKQMFCYVGQRGDLKMRQKVDALLALWDRLQNITEVAFTSFSHEEVQQGREGEGRGTVRLERENANTLIFFEEGSWGSTIGKHFSFSNAFRWELNANDATLALSHLRFGREFPVFLFHLVPINKTTFRSLDSHLCAHDSYMGQIQLSPKDITFFWRILGPKKNEELIYRYF